MYHRGAGQASEGSCGGLQQPSPATPVEPALSNSRTKLACLTTTLSETETQGKVPESGLHHIEPGHVYETLGQTGD